LKVQKAIHVQPVVMSHHNNIVISRKVFAIIGKEIVTAAAGNAATMHVNHYWAFVGAIDLRCP
jgi:hypothetical protein